MDTPLIKANLYEYQGKMYTLTELAELSGIKRATIQKRLNRGASVDDAMKS